jgi:gluconokinase
MIIIVMGVSGSGKTTVGSLLAGELRWEYYEGDDFHPPANVDKMNRDIPLNDYDRLPWLDELASVIDHLCNEHRDAVLAVSALKRKYRDYLKDDHPEVNYVHLKGSAELILRRMEARRHFMDSEMLASQFDALEEPWKACEVDISKSPEEIVKDIRSYFSL